MNYLAHMLLSFESDTLVTGNFLGDLLGNREIAVLPAAIREGVRLHRKIDFFTDTHPEVKKSTKLLHPVHGKYAPVLVDVYYDFFLARHWAKFHPDPITAFVKRVYQQLLSHQEVMPERTQRHLRAMVKDDWLMNYSTYEGMEKTFRRMISRVSKPEKFTGAVDSLKLHETALEGHFLHFFPEIVAYVKGEMA